MIRTLILAVGDPDAFSNAARTPSIVGKAECELGEIAVGGGYRWADGAPFTTPIGSYPEYDASSELWSWVVEVANTPSGPITIYAVCLLASP